MRMVGLDFSAVFDRVNHKALIFKLRQLGVCGPFLSILTEFLLNRLQRVVVDGQFNPLTPNPYCTESLPCAEGLGGAAAERNKRFYPKITARLLFKIKSSFFSPFLVNGYILSCKCQKCKKNNIIIYMEFLFKN